ncbi:MAG: PEP-CTERM sorting domain-containing protein [Planctomycetota bacterium]
MKIITGLILLVGLLCTPPALSSVVVCYSVDMGGNNTEPLDGLAARGTFELSGTSLIIYLENISTGMPASFDVGDSMLVSLGMNLPGVDFASGDAAVIAGGSTGIGAWSDRTAGDSVAEQWIWTNDFGGDFMEAYQHVISTSSGQGGGTSTRFDGLSGTVNGPSGGMATELPLLNVPGSWPAVSHSIRYELTLTDTLTESQLQEVADASIVEFGSDARYLGVPEPATMIMLVIGGLLYGRRR